MVKLSKKYIVLSIIFWFLTSLLDLFTAENITYKEADKKPLSDIIHRNTTWWPKTELVPSILVSVVFLYTLIRVAHINTNIICLMFVSLGILRLMRVMIYTSTQTPAAMPDLFNHCKRHLLNHVGLSFSQRKNTCVDNMFSAHTVGLIVPFILMLLSSNNFYEKLLLGIIVCITAVLIITSRMHYTADVLVASFMSLGFVHLIKRLFEKYNIKFN